MTSTLAVLCGLVGFPACPAELENDSPETVLLSNDWIKAEFQRGLLVRLKDRVTGAMLIDHHLETGWALLGGEAVDAHRYNVSLVRSEDAVTWTYQGGDKSNASLRWSIEPGHGDLVLRASAESVLPVAEMRVPVSGCQIVDHELVLVGQFGVGNSFRAPWNDHFLGDSGHHGNP